MTVENRGKLLSWLNKYKRLFIGIGTIFLVIIMIYIVDFSNLIDMIIKVGFIGTTLFVIAYTLTFIVRTFKLKFIFRGFDQNISFLTCFLSTGISFVINDCTPAKMGDIAKIGILKDQEHIKLSESVCAISIERVLDLILLFLLSCFAFIYLYYVDYGEGGTKTILGQNLQFFLAIGAIFLIGIFIFLILLYYKTELLINIISKVSPKIANLIEKFLTNFKTGIRKFKNHKKEFLYILLLEALIWTIEIAISVSFFLFLIEAGYDINILIIVLAIVITYFSKTFPITPGGWGVSENIGALFIIFFYPNIPYLLILSIFILLHLFRSGYLFFYGGYSTFHYNFRLKDIEKIKKEIEND